MRVLTYFFYVCGYIFAYELEGLGEALIYTQTYTQKHRQPQIYKNTQK